MAIYNYDVRIYDFEDNMIRKVRVSAKNYGDACGQATDIVLRTEGAWSYTMNLVY